MGFPTLTPLPIPMSWAGTEPHTDGGSPRLHDVQASPQLIPDGIQLAQGRGQFSMQLRGQMQEDQSGSMEQAARLPLPRTALSIALLDARRAPLAKPPPRAADAPCPPHSPAQT